jgi:serine protease AprX
VGRLSSDEVPVKKSDEFTVASSGADTAFGQYRLTGLGVAVAVLDSGVRASADLNDNKRNRIVASVSFVNGTKPTTDDLCGHGTHAAAIIAGNGAASTGQNYYRTFYGIARRADIVNVRVLDAYGQGTASGVIKGIEWVIANKSAYKIRVINLSLGRAVGESYTTDPLCLAVEKAWKAGIVVVCSAGNSGRLQSVGRPVTGQRGLRDAYGSIQSPGNSPYAITVGAMKASASGGGRSCDQIATYSSRGPTRLDFVLKPDLVAPGNRVISVNAPSSFLPNTYASTNVVPWTDFAKKYAAADTSKYFRLSGTSMAAPVVSGAVALLLQADPSLSPDTVKARLMLTADKWAFPDDTADACTFGAGYLNIPAALNSTVTVDPVPLRPQPDGFQDEWGNILVNMDRPCGPSGACGAPASAI